MRRAFRMTSDGRVHFNTQSALFIQMSRDRRYDAAGFVWRQTDSVQFSNPITRKKNYFRFGSGEIRISRILNSTLFIPEISLFE